MDWFSWYLNLSGLLKNVFYFILLLNQQHLYYLCLNPHQFYESTILKCSSYKVPLCKVSAYSTQFSGWRHFGIMDWISHYLHHSGLLIRQVLFNTWCQHLTDLVSIGSTGEFSYNSERTSENGQSTVRQVRQQQYNYSCRSLFSKPPFPVFFMQFSICFPILQIIPKNY